MAPQTPLPYSTTDFKSADAYVDSLLQFSAASTIFQTLCGGVHILDFFAREPSLYHTVIPDEWRDWLLARESMDLLDFLMRDDMSGKREDGAPESLVRYVQQIRRHSLCREVTTNQDEIPHGKSSEHGKLPRHISVGMIPKKIHEVSNFASYVVKVSDNAAMSSGRDITHFVDFGSGQNYLGRTLASPPYNKHIIAVESKEININGAKSMDVLAGVAEREIVMRNKKLFRQQQDSRLPMSSLKDKARNRVKNFVAVEDGEEKADLRPSRELKTIYTPEEGKGHIQYVEHRVQDGDLSDVVKLIEKMSLTSGIANIPNGTDHVEIKSTPVTEQTPLDPSLMAISIHSCGNLSHHGIRSLLLNPTVSAIAIVGCCYNLLTTRLSPPTYKHPSLRPDQRAINAPRLTQDLNSCDPHGFPMSERLEMDGMRLNITARMMAVQAPQNWTEKESDSFFTRHFYRALLQRLFLDKGVVKLTSSSSSDELERTEPVIIGSLRKGCYANFTSYVRGALEKLASNPERKDNRACEIMGNVTDEEIAGYEERFKHRKRELSITWSLMAFSAGVVESMIVVDRWLFLKEHGEVVGECWVEPVFDYNLSPRNLVVVGIKR